MNPLLLLLYVFVQDASSIVSLVCGTNKIAWTHVNRGMTVLDWQQLECPNFLKGTYMASTYLSDVSMTVGVHVVTEILHSDQLTIEAVKWQLSLCFNLTHGLKSQQGI